MENKVTYGEGMAAMKVVLDRLNDMLTDREEIACDRCDEWPCLCGDPDFEQDLQARLQRAEAEGKD